MANAMKAKGDREERAVLAIARCGGFPHAERTRAGRAEDQGDIHLDRQFGLAPGAICQVKDVRTINWTDLIDGLSAQIAAANADVGFASLKRSRPGKAPLRVAVMPLDDMLALLRRAGYGEPLSECA